MAQQKIGTSCTQNPSQCHCPLFVKNGCCRTRNVCCHEKTNFQTTIQECQDNIKHYKLQLRLLSDQFKKRTKSKCDDFTPLSKSQFERRKSRFQRNIDNCVTTIHDAKIGLKATHNVHTGETKPCNKCTPC